MVQVWKTIIVFAILFSNAHFVSTTSCYCTSHDSLVTVFGDNNETENTSTIVLRNKCFAGRIQGNLFCPENQSFCLNLEGLKSTSCDDTSERGSYSLSQFYALDPKEKLTTNPYVQYVDQKRFLVGPSWAEWGQWQECIASACGDGGIRTRERQCSERGSCVGDALELATCFKNCPAVGPSWAEWGQWQECIASACGDGGIRTRERQCSKRGSCVGDALELTPCFKNCSAQGTKGWSDWSTWSMCPVPCNSFSTSTRTRVCTAPDTSSCAGNAGEQKSCTVDGQWSKWSDWSNCSKEFFDGGLRNRIRKCNNPAPSCGGRDCDGKSWDFFTCSGETSWEPWVNSGHCYKTGDDGNTTGLQYRNRTCHRVLKNTTCEGSNEDWQPCTLKGVWSVWTVWSGCSETCGQGLKQRFRSCIDAVDLECAGSGIENQTCQKIENCPVDGKFSEWSAWSSCQVTCNGGPVIRTRYCNNPKPKYGGESCNGSFTETSVCNTQDCPVDGHWTDWADWNACSVSCGNGTKLRDRMCANPAPSSGGKDCEGPSSDADGCYDAVCSVDGEWGLWEVWTQCTCQLRHIRKRNCDNPAPVANGAYCVGEATETTSCAPDTSLNCPVNGGWTVWFQWGTVCSVTCGHGTVTRKRECSNPKPAYGGSPCLGEQSEGRDCDSIACPIDGAWSSWSAWSHCDVTCANGTQSRNRTCNKPEPAHGGKDCQGDMFDSKACTLKSCPIDGAWSDWQAWSSWDVTCARGSRSRARQCNNPAPAFGGHNCHGDINDFESKDLVKCQVDGGWSEWSAWFGCSVTCGLGINTRYRACNNPVPANHGKPCPAQDFKETINCLEIGCPVNGNWADWGAWGSCSATCSNGTRVKTRTCTNPAPKYNGKTCSGSSTDTDDCYSGHCPIDGSWTDWSAWYPCSVTCGDGYKLRNRSCDNPAPQYNGLYCVGHSVDNATCNDGHCAIDGAWGSWLAWEDCAASCEDGIRLRHRKCDNPAPQYGGANCTGINEESDACNKGPCPTDGLWASWVPWSHCSGDCTTGTKQRFRNCNNPAPSNGGAFCTGAPLETTSCLPQNCPTLMRRDFTNASSISTTTDFKCYVCDTSIPELCIAHKREETCHQPYCVNELTNKADGTKLLNRRCGTKMECDKDWWKMTSENDKCTLFDLTETVTNYVHCTFCCVDELCNDQIIPPNKSLYKPLAP